jgi:hypothetical protein
MTFVEHVTHPSNSIQEDYFYHLDSVFQHLEEAHKAEKEARIELDNALKHLAFVKEYTEKLNLGVNL